MHNDALCLNLLTVCGVMVLVQLQLTKLLMQGSVLTGDGFVCLWRIKDFQY